MNQVTNYYNSALNVAGDIVKTALRSTVRKDVQEILTSYNLSQSIGKGPLVNFAGRCITYLRGGMTISFALTILAAYATLTDRSLLMRGISLCLLPIFATLFYDSSIYHIAFRQLRTEAMDNDSDTIDESKAKPIIQKFLENASQAKFLFKEDRTWIKSNSSDLSIQAFLETLIPWDPIEE